MVKSKLIKSFAVLAIAVPLTWGYSVASDAAEESFTEQKQYETTNIQDDGTSQFPEKMERDGKQYTRQIVVVKILKETSVPRDVVTFDSDGFTGDPEAHKPAETIEREGKTYQLKESSLIDTTVAERTKDISTVIPYKGVEFIDSLPMDGDIEVEDEDTHQKVNAKLPYQGHAETRSYWSSDFTVPVTVVVYDAETYQLGDLEIPGGTDLTLYSREILEYLGLPEEYYQITEVVWDEDVYESNGELCRDAVATGQKLLRDIDVSYAGTVTFEEVQAKAYNCIYVVAPEEISDTIYTMEASAIYEQNEAEDKNSFWETFWRDLWEWIKNHPVQAVVCLALLLLLLWLIAFLFLLARRNKKRKSTEIIIHEEGEDEENGNDWVN